MTCSVDSVPRQQSTHQISCSKFNRQFIFYFWTGRCLNKLTGFVTARVRSTREGNVLTRVCPSINLSVHRGGYPYPIMLCNISQNAMRQRGVPGSGPRGGVPGPPRGVPGSGTPRGGTRVRYPPGGGTRVRYPPRGVPG